MRLDAYSPRVAFDDLYGESAPPPQVSRGDVERVCGAIVRQADRWRLAPPPMSIAVIGVDAATWSFTAPGAPVLGDDSTGAYPIFGDLYRRFTIALPEPKIMRLDTEASYCAFRDTRRLPYILRLEERLANLEGAVASHVADHHGGGRLADLEERFEQHIAAPSDDPLDEPSEEFYARSAEVLGALEEVKHGGSSVPLPLPDWALGKIECWQDGAEILCTIRLASPEGKLLMATTGAPAERYVEEVLGYARQAGVGGDELYTVGPAIVQVLGGRALCGQLCKAAPELLGAADAPFVSLMTPNSNPKLAAAMALLQRSQRGDVHAAAEVAFLKSHHEQLLAEAQERLLLGQREKSQKVHA